MKMYMLTDSHGHKQPFNVVRDLAEKRLRTLHYSELENLLSETFGHDGMIWLFLDNADPKEVIEWAVDEDTECFGNYEAPSEPLGL